MRLLILLSLTLSMTFSAGCVSQGTLDRAKATAIELGKDAVSAAVESGKAKLGEVRDAAIKDIDAKAAEKLTAMVGADADLSEDDRRSLLDQIATREAVGGLGGLGTLAALAMAYAKSKAAGKLKRTLGLVTKSIEKAPEDIAQKVRDLVRANGGSDPEIKATISEAKA